MRSQAGTFLSVAAALVGGRSAPLRAQASGEFKPGQVATTSLPCHSPTMTAPAFLRISGIEGESRDPCHPREIDLISFTAGAQSQRFVVVKRIDRASPGLVMASMSGRVIPHASVTALASGGATPKLMTYELDSVTVASLAQTVGPGMREDVVLVSRKFRARIEDARQVLSLPPEPGPVQIFLRLDGILGDSKTSGQEGEIAAIRLADAASSGRFQDFAIEKAIDGASAKIRASFLAGKHIPSAAITLRRSDGTDFLRFRLSDLVIASDLQSSGSLHERLELRFAKFEIDYSATGLRP